MGETPRHGGAQRWAEVDASASADGNRARGRLKMESSTSTRAVPRAVRYALGLLAVVAVSHLIVPVVMWADQGDLRTQIASQHPGFDAAEIARSADVAVVSGGVFHILLLALCVLLLWKLPAGRPWTRWLATV